MRHARDKRAGGSKRQDTSSPYQQFLDPPLNPGLEFSIPGFGIIKFAIPGSRRDWRGIVKTTKIATWVTRIRVAIFDLQVRI